MARDKTTNYHQTKMIPLRFADQILPGTFEYALNHVVDNDLDLKHFHQRYRNDTTGAPAYDPAVLLKIVLLAYSRGITSRRQSSGSAARCSPSTAAGSVLGAPSKAQAQGKLNDREVG